MDSVLDLISTRTEQNEYGVMKEIHNSRTVFCEVRSITRSEFFDAGRNGMNPSLEFLVFAGDYEGESIVEYEGKRYAIYRTYIVPGTDYIELYAERQGGRNGA